MQRFFAAFWPLLKVIAVQFGALIPAIAGLHLVGTFVYHSMPTSMLGSGIVMSFAAVVWLWYCLRSGYPPLLALSTLALNSTLWFFVLIAVFRARFMLDHYESIAKSDVVVFLVSALVATYLGHIFNQRVRNMERMDDDTNQA